MNSKQQTGKSSAESNVKSPLARARHFVALLLSCLFAALAVPESRGTVYTFQEFSHPGASENFTLFSAINNSGLIAGHYGSGTPDNETVTAFTFDGVSYSTFSVPGAWGTFARGINSAGVVVGEFGLPGLPAGGGGAFIYDGTSFTTFNHPAETDNSTIFDAINDADLVAGHYSSGTPGNETVTAFTFDGVSYSTFSVPGAWGTFARGINSAGVVVGEFGRDSGGGAFIAQPVPEPSTVALVCVATLAMLWRKKARVKDCSKKSECGLNVL